jgi:hypothetical protein
MMRGTASPLFLVLAWALLMSVAFCLFLPREAAWAFREEGGPLETATVALYLLAAAAVLALALRGEWSGGYGGSVVLLLLALRELDVHRRFTGLSVTGTKFWVSPDSPLFVKGAALLATAFGLGAVAVFLRGRIGAFVRCVRRGDPPCLSILGGILIVPFSLILDQVPRPLKKAGLWSEELFLALSLFEETFELAIPVLFLVAILQWRAAGKGQPTLPATPPEA